MIILCSFSKAIFPAFLCFILRVTEETLDGTADDLFGGNGDLYALVNALYRYTGLVPQYDIQVPIVSVHRLYLTSTN
jgi:hypothetical protein